MHNACKFKALCIAKFIYSLENLQIVEHVFLGISQHLFVFFSKYREVHVPFRMGFQVNEQTVR